MLPFTTLCKRHGPGPSSSPADSSHRRTRDGRLPFARSVTHPVVGSGIFWKWIDWNWERKKPCMTFFVGTVQSVAKCWLSITWEFSLVELLTALSLAMAIIEYSNTTRKQILRQTSYQR